MVMVLPEEGEEKEEESNKNIELQLKNEEQK